MMRNLMIFFLVITMIIACDRTKLDDLGGTEVLRGRLILDDELYKEVPASPLAKKKVVLRYKENAEVADYLFSTTTDDDGYFTFTNLKDKTAYTASYSETVEGVTYSAAGSMQTPESGLVLRAGISTNQTGLVLKLKDYTGNVLKDIDICLFRSPDNLGYLSNNCDGSQYTMKTEANGKARLFGISPGKYYALSNFTLNGVPLSIKKEIIVSDKVLYDSLELASPNGLVLTVTDPSGNTLKEKEVCLFTSSDNIGYINNNCEGSRFSSQTDGNGKAKFYGIPNRKYYALSSTLINGVPLTGKSEVEVGSGISNEVLKLSLPNGIAFTTTDEELNPISDVDLCIFSSKILFDLDTCTGSNYHLTSLADGKIIKYGLPVAKYYVIASKVIDGDIWIGRASVDVGAVIINSIIPLKKK